MGKAQRKAVAVETPPGMDGDWGPCTIQFGHNATIGKVLMVFGQACGRVVLTPESAENIAQQLLERASLARGDKN